MILLDTTVLVYAKGQEHSLREPCRELIDAVAEGRLEATTTVEAIQEFVHVRSRRRERVDAVEMGVDYIALLSPLLRPDDRDLLDGLALYERQETLGAFDAVLAAAALNAGIDALVSADASFAQVARLTHVVPDAGGVASLLSA
ncbi:MAG TPA: type II toxin-antitoxin system VapC family toxin [Solirubrobacteraceae bacterium]|jgi:hypothetical protein